MVTVLARPCAETLQDQFFGGAYINCWIAIPSEAAAISRAEAEVRESGWIPESIEGIVEVAREDYGPDDTERKYFDQAIVDGVVLVVHSFPSQT